MITIEVICSAKNSRLEGVSDVYTDVTFQPLNSPKDGYAAGAAIGVPNPNKLQSTTKLSYNLVSGSLVVCLSEQKEADKYEIGKSYSLSLKVK